MSERVMWAEKLTAGCCAGSWASGNCSDSVYRKDMRALRSRPEALLLASKFEEESNARLVKVTFKPRAKPAEKSLEQVGYEGFYGPRGWDTLDRKTRCMWNSGAMAVEAEVLKRHGVKL